jgi:hypothetical protein
MAALRRGSKSLRRYALYKFLQPPKRSSPYNGRMKPQEALSAPKTPYEQTTMLACGQTALGNECAAGCAKAVLQQEVKTLIDSGQSPEQWSGRTSLCQERQNGSLCTRIASVLADGTVSTSILRRAHKRSI